MAETAAFRGRLLGTLRLQYPDICADRGYQLLHPVTGDVYTEDERHLVATCRGIANFAIGSTLDGPEWCTHAAEHGFTFLRTAHAAESEGYHLLVSAAGEPIDDTRSAYAHAFALLASARAVEAGLDDATDVLSRVAALVDQRFLESNGLLRSDCDSDWSEREPYRGQNANMHACEAYIAAYEATEDPGYLERATTIARAITIELAEETDGKLWEHYDEDWTHDFGYNADEPRHQFRPPGYQPGHHLEWAKLVGLIDRYQSELAETDEEWFDVASALFDVAVELGWTGDGFVYTVDRTGDVLVSDRYAWGVAEGIGAAAVLTERADARDIAADVDHFRTWHNRLVRSSDHFRGPAGPWFQKRTADSNAAIAPEPPGVEPDYHPIGAWFESWRSLDSIA